jgi:hypothetical protein
MENEDDTDIFPHLPELAFFADEEAAIGVITAVRVSAGLKTRGRRHQVVTHSQSKCR